MPKKYTLEYIQQQYASKGWLFLDNYYVGSKYKHNVQCVNKHAIKKNYNSFQRNINCDICNQKKQSQNKSYSLNYIKQQYKNENWLFLDKTYINNQHLHNVMCNNQHKLTMRYADFQQNHRCAKCYSLQQREDKSYSLNYIKQQYKEKGWQYMDTNYKNNKEKHNVMCNNQHQLKLRFNGFQQGIGCKACSNSGTSQPEQEIIDFIAENYAGKIEQSNRTVLEGKEIDIYLPELKVGIEYHGLYWHSAKVLENFKKIHREKHELAKEKGVHLIQFFEDEWRDKRKICESMILHRIKSTPRTIFARKCTIQEVNKKDREQFFNETHISGDVRSTFVYGLYYKNQLVACLSFRKPYTKKHAGAMEIARYACSTNTSVVGGFQKLLKVSVERLKNDGFQKLITYADARYGYGNVYLKSGFTLDGMTSPGYCYTNIKSKEPVRTFRFKHKRNNDPEFVKKWGKTEKEQNHNQGFYEIYDCGHYLYSMNL